MMVKPAKDEVWYSDVLHNTFKFIYKQYHTHTDIVRRKHINGEVHTHLTKHISICMLTVFNIFTALVQQSLGLAI